MGNTVACCKESSVNKAAEQNFDRPSHNGDSTGKKEGANGNVKFSTKQVNNAI